MTVSYYSLFIKGLMCFSNFTIHLTANNIMRPTVGVQTPGVGSERMNVKVLCTYATII